MRRATELDLRRGMALIDCENKQLILKQRYNANTWLAWSPNSDVQLVSVVDINKYRVSE